MASHRTAPRTDDRALLRRVGFDVLHRSLRDAETRMYLGAPPEMVAGRLLRSEEAMAAWLEEALYYFLLLDNFRPETDAIRHLPGRLARREATVRDAIAEILLSTGFSLRNPGNDTFVTVVLEQCLGVEVQARDGARLLAAGKRMYDGYPTELLGTRGASQADFVRIVLGHRDFAATLLDRHHRRLLGEPLGSGEDAAGLVTRLDEDAARFWPILVEWFGSERYAEGLAQPKPKTDAQFLRALHIDLLGRLPTADELRNMRNASQALTDPAPIRAVLARVILESGEARLPPYDAQTPDGAGAFVDACFRRFLGRDPTTGEREAFAEALTSGEADPTHVARALVGSPEYQYY